MKQPIKSLGKTILSCLSESFEQKAGPPLMKSLLRQHYLVQPREKTFRNTLYRLHTGGLIKKEESFWKITNEGKKIIKNFIPRPNYPKIQKNLNQNLIVVFDIPEKKRFKRKILRTELVALDFKPIQKSVWIGNGPIPSELIKYLKEFEILDHTHIFEIKPFSDIK